MTSLLSVRCDREQCVILDHDKGILSYLLNGSTWFCSPCGNLSRRSVPVKRGEEGDFCVLTEVSNFLDRRMNVPIINT